MKPHLLEVRPGRVHGTARAVPSKSVTQRAFLLAAQSDEPCTVRAPSLADDPRAMLAGLIALGARAHLDPDRPETVQFLPARLRGPTAAIDCRNSGTALRLLTATAARLPTPTTLTGDDSLRARPNGPLLATLRALGARASGSADHAAMDGLAPLTVQGPLRPGPVRLDASASSQFASALLLSLPMLPGPSVLHLDGTPASRPYVALTLDVAHRFAIPWQADGPHACATSGNLVPRAASFDVEGDWSAAAFLLAAAAVTGGDVTVTGLRTDSVQGDRAIVDHLRAFGATVDLDAAAGSVRCRAGAGLVSPGRIDLAATPDLGPPLAAVAACAQGTTTFTGAAHLRHKESDRIAALVAGLTQMGAGAVPLPDGLVVTGGPLRGANVACRGDHRIHMAFAVLALAATGPSRIDSADAVGVSHPGFHADLAGIGADVRGLHGNRTVLA